FALAALWCLMTVRAGSHGGALKSLTRWPLPLRLANAADAVLCYLGQTFVPVDLAAYYPYPRAGLPPVQVAAAVAVVALVTLLVCWQARRRPFGLVGWLWFLGTLVPVLGLVQIGSQARADRFTYVPLIGLFAMIVWGLRDLVPGWWRLAPLLVALAACVVLS